MEVLCLILKVYFYLIMYFIYILIILQYYVICVNTGVRNLHKEASKYDIAIYFEANGHGSVIHFKYWFFYTY